VDIRFYRGGPFVKEANQRREGSPGKSYFKETRVTEAENNFHELRGAEGMKKIGDLVKGIRIAMLCTIDGNGQIHSRPMATQDEPFNGTLWFLTRISSEKIGDIERRHNITLDYADPSNSKYVTLRGTASSNQDKSKIKELWNPMYKAWFPNGVDDPEIAVLKVEVTEGDYWEANSSKIVMGIRYVAAAVTGGKVPLGEAGHVAVK
jgi:general stress protein 26